MALEDPYEEQTETCWRMEPEELVRVMMATQSPTAERIATARLRLAAEGLSPESEADRWERFYAIYAAVHRVPGARERMLAVLRQLRLVFAASQDVTHPRFGRGRVVSTMTDGQVMVKFDGQAKAPARLWPFQLEPVA